MGYLDSRGIISIVDQFLEEIGRKSEVDGARSFFTNSMQDLGREFERGSLEREGLAREIQKILEKFRVYLSGTELSDLDKRINRF